MKRILSGAIALSTCLHAVPANAQQSSNTTLQQCETALSNAESLLVNNRHLWIVDSGTSSLEESGYQDFPQRRSVAFGFVMGGNAVDDVMNSTQLLTTIAQSIMQRCPGVGMVSFTADQSDWSTSFGWIGNRAREFECLNPGDVPRTPWGYQFCI